MWKCNYTRCTDAAAVVSNSAGSNTISTGIFQCRGRTPGRKFANTMDHCRTYWECGGDSGNSALATPDNQQLGVCAEERYFSNSHQVRSLAYCSQNVYLRGTR